MKDKIKFVYFDVGGVMLWFDGFFESLAKRSPLLDEELEKIFNRIDKKVCLGEMNTDEVWGLYQKEMKVKGKLEKKLDEYFVDFVDKIPETHALAKVLESKVGLGILSNVWGEIPRLVREKKCIPKVRFDVQINSNEVGMVKPSKEIFKLATKLAKVEPDKILLIDDNKENLEGAKKFGWQAFQFDPKDPKKSVKELRDLLGI